jgi:hypothetical protein
MKLLVIIFLFFSTQGYSRILYQPLQTTRSLGMGGTNVSFVRGVDALFLNPAALARVEGYAFTIGEVQAAYSTNATWLVNQFNNSGATLTLADILQLSNTTYFADLSSKTGMVFPYFGLGAYSAGYDTLTFGSPLSTTFHSDFVSDYGITMAGAIPLGQNVSIGLAARSLKRWAGDSDISVLSLVGGNTVSVIEAAIPDKGTGVAMDLSFLATFGGDLNPSVGIVWKDVGHTRFAPTAGVGPNDQDDLLILGASIQHPFAFGSWTHAIEYKYINLNGEDFSKKISVGTEASFGIIDLRAGIYQGRLTYGAAFDISFIRAEAAAYSTELGSKAGQSTNDRYQASISINLDFDQAFKMAKDGKKRRLMQRR